MEIKDYSLKWTKDNFNFWTKAIENKEVSSLNSKFYNSKVNELIDNDNLFIDMIKDIDEEYSNINGLRVKFKDLKPFLEDSLYRDLDSLTNIYNLFDAYASGMKFFYVNSDVIEKYNTIKDSYTFIDIDNDGNWDYVISNGVKEEYGKFMEETGISNPTSNDLEILGLSNEVDMCKKEFTYVTSEYSFC